MKITHRRNSFVMTVIAAAALAWVSSDSRAQTSDKASVSDKASAFVGAWTLNKELGREPETVPQAGERGPGAGGPRGGGFGRGRGGFGGGGRGGGFGGGDGAANAEANARQREAMRDITNPPEHLIIVATDTMIVLTSPDGRATRLSPDGKKIKEENTNIERKTKWDGARLVSEISGLGPGKATQTFSVDAERHQLHVVAEVEGGRGGTRTFSHIYDFDGR